VKAKRTLAVVLLAWLSLLAVPAWADYFRPAYLQLNERPDGLYDIRWKTPAQSETVVMAITPVFPPGSEMAKPLSSSYAAGAAVMVGAVRTPGGLEGKTIRFQGRAETGNQALVRIIRQGGQADLYQVAPTDPQVTIPRAPGAIGVSARYTQLGVEHIWRGFDHLLFVTGLTLLVSGRRTLFLTITSFTLAHSITLALVTLDVIRVPTPPVEAFIALSIVFVAVEAIRRSRGHESLASRKPWLVAFTFGLLHGLGFASALAAIGLPQNNVPLALLFFNVGVEIGQIAFVAALLTTIHLARRFAVPAQLGRARLTANYAIGGLASYWLLERISSFF
jgi:hydrogenase/urease accessory protein HupE